MKTRHEGNLNSLYYCGCNDRDQKNSRNYKKIKKVFRSRAKSNYWFEFLARNQKLEIQL